MQAKICLCDPSRESNVSCGYIYLEPIKIEILGKEELLEGKTDLIERFDLDEKLVSDTSWVKDITKIYYLEKEDLYSINTDGSQKRKVTDGLTVRSFNWSPSGDKMLVRTGKELIIMNPDGTHQERILTTKARFLLISNLEWSPDGKFISFGIPYTLFGKVYYVINLITKEKIKIFQEQQDNYPRDSVETALWSKDAKKIYIFNRRFFSSNDFLDQVFEYDITSRNISKIYEKRNSSWGDLKEIEKRKDVLFFTRKNFDSGIVTTELEEENGIKIVHQQEGVILQKRLQKDIKKYRLDNPYSCRAETDNFFWLPGKKYIIFEYYGICILDPYEMKVGRLVKGYNFGWFEKDSDYNLWKTKWYR